MTEVPERSATVERSVPLRELEHVTERIQRDQLRPIEISAA
jgi:hypothetical protein